MRRPVPLRRTGLRAQHFKLIGEIAVLSGMIEDTLKRIPLAMLNVPYVPGVAFTAHLKASSLCDMIMAMADYIIRDADRYDELADAIAAARRSADARNDILHGPFDFFDPSRPTRVAKLTARSQLKAKEETYSGEKLNAVLSELIATWERVADCYVGISALVEERVRHGHSPLRPDFVQRANRQTQSEQDE